MKNITYRNLYSKIDDVEKDIKDFLMDKNTNNILLNNYRDTLKHFVSFLERNEI